MGIKIILNQHYFQRGPNLEAIEKTNLEIDKHDYNGTKQRIRK